MGHLEGSGEMAWAPLCCPAWGRQNTGAREDRSQKALGGASRVHGRSRATSQVKSRVQGQEVWAQATGSNLSGGW